MENKELISKLLFWVGFFTLQIWVFYYLISFDVLVRIVAHFSLVIGSIGIYGNPFKKKVIIEIDKVTKEMQSLTGFSLRKQ